MATELIPLIVITGPTASGKTDVGLRLAEELGGEIVCADSRTIYKGLDIGTAKPTVAERDRVPHYLLDVVSPDEPYDLARFQREARRVIADIRQRGKVPFLVGGSGLYVDSVVLEYELGAEPDPVLRAELEAMDLEQLHDYSRKHSITLPENSLNKRYIIRAIEQKGINNARLERPRASTIVVGINTEPEVLKQRIQRRAQTMFDHGLADETERALEVYGDTIAPLQSPAYKAIRRLLRNEISKEEAIASLAHDDWQLARKQMTWMRRNKWIHWLPLEEVEPYVRSIITQATGNDTRD